MSELEMEIVGTAKYYPRHARHTRFEPSISEVNGIRQRDKWPSLM